MTEMIDVSRLRDLAQGYAECSNETLFEHIRRRIGYHPEDQVREWMLQEADKIELEIFPERGAP